MNILSHHVPSLFPIVDEKCGRKWFWIADSGEQPSHIYVPKGESATGATFFSRQGLDCCRVLLESLRGEPRYRLVFENEGAAIFERTGR